MKFSIAAMILIFLGIDLANASSSQVWRDFHCDRYGDGTQARRDEYHFHGQNRITYKYKQWHFQCERGNPHHIHERVGQIEPLAVDGSRAYFTVHWNDGNKILYSSTETKEYKQICPIGKKCHDFFGVETYATDTKPSLKNTMKINPISNFTTQFEGDWASVACEQDEDSQLYFQDIYKIESSRQTFEKTRHTWTEGCEMGTPTTSVEHLPFEILVDDYGKLHFTLSVEGRKELYSLKKTKYFMELCKIGDKCRNYVKQL